MAITRFFNATICTLADVDYGLIPNGELLVENGRIVDIGVATDSTNCDQNIDLKGALLLPGLIDCHTHLVHGGSRANEFEQRLNGVSYADIAKAGGGIVSTVKATRESSELDLYELSVKRLQSWLNEGITTIEIKSGYGLSTESEAKMLRVAQMIGERLPISVRKTFLGAHALPAEFAGRADDYIAHICEEMMPKLHQQGLIDAVDVFCEGIGFSWAQTQRVFHAAKRLSLPIKIHAEQLSDLKGARNASVMGALSADHLEYLADEDVSVLRDNDTVAVLLPGAYYFLRETKLPPMQALRQHKVPIAIATDNNPGSSPAQSLLLMMNMACTLFKMTPLEALQGVTIHAAKALGLAHDRGSLVIGKRADFAVYDVSHPAELCYRFGHNPCIARCFEGQFAWHG